MQEELAQLRSRVAEGEEWQRKREAEVELLRNALQRRDALLVSQRTSFYRELLSHQDYANIASVGSMQPSVTLDEMHRLERFATAGQKAAERPAFFDACIFEAAHLELDEPLARKVTAALRAAVSDPLLAEECTQRVVHATLAALVAQDQARTFAAVVGNRVGNRQGDRPTVGH